MNFVKYYVPGVRTLGPQTAFYFFLVVVLLSACFVGCGDNVRLPSENQVSEFEIAGPLQPEVDTSRLVKAKTGTGPYRVVPNDLLDLQIPAILRLDNVNQLNSLELSKPYLCRVYDDGTITLPIIGKVPASGKTLAEIETIITNAYYPRWYSVKRPSIVALVVNYHTVKVSIVGSVESPGIYELRNDQMSLVSLIMMAGGIAEEGAAVIRITHQQDAVADADKAEVPRERPTPLTDYPETGKVEVQLAFNQLSPPETTGLLTMRHNKTILLTEQMDISSEIQRRAVIEKLAQKDSRFSTQQVNYRLCELAERLKQDSGSYNSDSQTAYATNTDSTGTVNASDSSRPNTLSDEDEDTETLLEALQELQREIERAPVQKIERPTQPQSVAPTPLEKDFPKILGLEKSLEMRETTDLVKVKKPQTLILPVKGFNIPFADVALQEGDSIEVERLELPLVTVVGLVAKPGNFKYPPNVQYNLMQAIGFAGGLNQVAEPRYATVYRLKADGEIVSAAFEFRKGSGLTGGSNVLIKPGDIVDVEQTPRTRTKLFLDRFFRVNLGLYVPLDDITD